MIQNSAMLVELNISTWTGRKMDKKVSDEIDASKNTRAKGGNYHKKLLAGTQTLEELQKLVASVRTWHYEQTLPWSDGGSRLLPMKNFFDYKTKLTEFEHQFDESVRDFLVEYDTSVTAAAFQLGELFDKDDYPEAIKLMTKFKFNYVFLPVPTVGDFRIDVNDVYQEELRQQYDTFYTTKLNDAMQDAWDRLHGCLSRISEKLGGDDKQIFRDSLVTNAEDVCELLTKLNVTNDPKLETARKMLESALIGVSAKGLRQEEDTRAHVKAKVDEILGMFN
jgi:hypothetical protein